METFQTEDLFLYHKNLLPSSYDIDIIYHYKFD